MLYNHHYYLISEYFHLIYIILLLNFPFIPGFNLTWSWFIFFLSTLLDLYRTMFYVNFHCNEMLSLFCWFFSQHLWKLMVEESDLLGQLKVIA